MSHHRKQFLAGLKRFQCGADSFASDDAPIDLVALVFTDDDGSFILWHTRGIGMHERVLHQNAGDLAKRLVRSAIGAVSFPGYSIRTKVFFEGRGRGNLHFMFSSPRKVQSGVNHVVGYCVGVDSACDSLGVRVRWGINNP